MAPDGYTVRLLRGGSITPADQEGIYELLLGYGPHYPEHFGLDMRRRLAAEAGAADGADGLLCAVATAPDGAVASHACVIYEPGRPSNGGLFGAVLTHEGHRRKGLSTAVCRACLAAWDALGGESVGPLVLGTGSPSAARTYQKEGFSHLMGGLEGGHQGYNPDDLGEWLLLRWRCGGGGGSFTAGTGEPEDPGAGLDAFRAAHFFRASCSGSAGTVAVGDFAVEALSRRHWAGLALLFMSFPGEGKLPAAGISTGLEAEEAIARHMNTAAACGEEAMDPRRARFLVVVHRETRRIHGFSVEAPAPAQQYVVPGCEPAAEALRAAREQRSLEPG